MGFGIDISELSDVEIASLCAQAAVTIDAYCNTPRIPQQHDFRGGTITEEQHGWRLAQSSFELGQRRVYPYHWPIKALTQFRIYVTNTQYIEIAPTELYLNQSERYLEVVSLAMTSAGLWGALIVPNIGLATPVSRISYTYGWNFTETDEVLYDTDAQLFRAQNQFWATTPAPIIYKNGTVVTSGFAIDYSEGTVTFTDQLEASDVITATYNYKLPREIMFAAGHIVAYLHGEQELHGRGMAHLERIKVAEIELVRPKQRRGSDPDDLAEWAPEAASLLSSFKDDNITVR